MLRLAARRNAASALFTAHGPARTMAGPATKYTGEGKDPALEAGFVRGLFLGKFREEQLFPYPEVMSQEQLDETAQIVGPMEKFFWETNTPAKNDLSETVDPAIVEQMKAMGAFGLQVPEDLGGAGLNATQYARMAEIMGANDLGASIFIGAHQSIGFKGILLEGTPEQKAKYLPALAKGERYAAFALTEPSSGSDANSIRSRAVLSPDGKHYILNGGKIWISNGGIAEVFTVFAQTPVKDAKTGKIVDKVTAFIVERAFGGLTNGPPEKKMGIKCSNTASLTFEDVKIPVENVIGEVGGGFKVAMNILNNGRFGMVAAMTGTQKFLIKGVTEHATQRVQFGKKISEFTLTKGKFADMALRCYASEALAYMISNNMDRGSKDYQLEAAIGKVYASEAAWQTADESIQIMGGLGFMKDLPYERVMRDLRIFRIFEGTNDILRMFVALTGMQAAGKELRELQKAMKNPLANVGTVFKEVVARFGSAAQLKGAHPELSGSGVLISKYAMKFGVVTRNLLIKHGKGIADQQLLLKRVADSVIDLYAMSAVTARATRALTKKLPTAAHEKLLATAFCEQAAARLEISLGALANQAATTSADRKLENIADEMFAKGGYHATPPLGF